MEKLEIKSGENQITVGANLSGTGTTESPVGYIGDIQHSDKRELLWESTGNDYNTNIELSETINHFDKVMIYGSGLEAADTMHASKNVYTVQPNLINGCDVWCYSPWTTSFQANYILGARLRLSGNTGYIGSSYYWGIGSKNASWAAGKWTGTEAPKMLMPWKIFGLGRHPTYNFYGLPSEGGSVASNIPSGYSGDIATITVTPESDVWRQSALNITGAELTGNDFMFGNSNVTAQAEFEHSRDLTLENGDHGVLSADKMSGFSGDVVTVDATTDEGWYLSAIALTGAEATGFKFMFTGSDVTALGEYTDVGFPITYLSDEHVSVDGPSIYIPGQSGITLDSGYDTYYRISGYDIENGSINEEGLLIPTGPCTVKAIEKVNYFTATGNYNYSNQTSKNDISKTYSGILKAVTGELPNTWGNIDSQFNPSNASGYSAHVTPRVRMWAETTNGYVTGQTKVNSTNLASKTAKLTVTTTQNRPSTTFNLEASTTTQGPLTLYLRAKNDFPGYYNHGWDQISYNGWTATGIAP